MASIQDRLKEFYLRLEDRWYDFLDLLDRKKIPVYKVVDALEEKNIPSFPVAIVAALLIVALLFMALGPIMPAAATLTVSIQDDSGTPIDGALVSLSGPGVAAQSQLAVDGLVELQVPLDNEITVRVEADGFEIAESNFKVDLPNYNKIIVLSSELTVLTKTIQLKSNVSGTLLEEEITVSFSCSNRYDYARTLNVLDGQTVLADIPLDCGLLYVVPQEFEAEVDYIDLADEGSAEIFLQAIDYDTGSVNVAVKDSAGNPIAGLIVNIYTSQGSYYENAYSGASGIAAFENVPVDAYFVTVIDDTGTYMTYSGEEDVKNVLKDETAEFEAVVQRGEVGKIRLMVLDSTTKLPVDGAAVTLFKQLEGTKTEASTVNYTNAEGKVEIAVADAASYYALVDHPFYLLHETGGLTKSAEGVFTEVNLEEATAANSQTLIARVLDESGEPISGVRAKLYQNNEIVGAEETTGANGIVTFERLEQASYQVYVYKPGYGETISNEVEVLPRVENRIDVVLPLGQGTLEITAKNGEGQAVSGAVIGVYDAFTHSPLGDKQLTTAEGRRSINVRSDKKVYLVIESADYLTYTTRAIQMAKDVSMPVDVILLDDVSKFELVFQGFFVGQENAQNYLNENQAYTARFQLRVPKEGGFDEIGVHLRTGAEESGQSNIMENDGMYFKSVTSSAGKTIKGTSYTPAVGFGTDALHLTNGSSKWVNLTWDNPRTGVYEIEAEMQVRDIEKGALLLLHYRGWGKTGTYLRFPVDNELGNLENTASKQALYANTKKEFFSVGPSNLCVANFCTILSVEDLTENIETAIVDEFSAKIANNYKLLFTVSNSGSRAYEDAKLKLFNDTQSLAFLNYTANVKGKEQSATLTESDVEISLGTLGPGDVVVGELTFRTEKDGISPLNIEVIAGKEKVMQKPVKVNVAPAKTMAVFVLPKTIVPYITNEVLVKVEEEDTQALANALVKLKLDDDLIGTGNTDSRGEFAFTLNDPRNGSVLEIIVEKNGFQTVSKEMKVNEQVLSINPDKLQEYLVTTGISEKEEGIIISNLTEIPLTITNVELNGNFRDYLEIDFKENYVNTELNPDTDYNIVFQLSLTEKGKTIAEPMKLSGTLDFSLYNEDYSTWVNKMPLEVRVAFGDQLDEPDCLLISPQLWNIFTSEDAQTLEIRVKNNCTVDGQPIDLQAFEAKLDRGNSNDLGKFELESEIGAGTKFTLDSTYQSIADLLPNDSDNTLTLTFDPKRVNAAKAEQKIIFKAVNKTQKGDEIIEIKAKVNLQINNLTKCIKISGTENLIVESCPMNTGYNNYTRYGYNPQTGNNQLPSWMQRTSGPQTPAVTSGMQGYAPTTSTSGLQQYANRYPSQNYREPFFDSYNMSGNQGAWNCGQAQFRIENSCTADVEIDLDAHPYLNVGESSFLIPAGEDVRVKVGESMRIGKYPITIEGRIKDSDEPSVEVKTVNVLVRSPTEINNDCIKLTSPADGKFRFNSWPIQKPVKGEVTNYCYDQGVRLSRDSVTAASFAGGTTMVTRVIPHEPYEKPGSEGKTLQILEFELEKDLSYQQKADFPTAKEPVEWLVGVRAWTSESYRNVEETRNMVIKYIDPYQQARARSEIIHFIDLWQIPLGKLVKFGNLQAQPQDCIQNIDLGIVSPLDFAGKNYAVKTADPQVLKISNEACGFTDKLSSLYPATLEKDGVKLDFRLVDSGRNIEIIISKTPEMKSDVDIDTELKANLFRFFKNETKEVRIKVKFKVDREGVTGLNATQQSEFDKRKNMATLAEALKGVTDPATKKALENWFANKEKLEACAGLEGFKKSGLENELGKVFLDWRWEKIYADGQKNCNDGATYCDAAQFGIELSKRFKPIKEAYDNAYDRMKLNLTDDYCFESVCSQAVPDCCANMANSADFYRLSKMQVQIRDKTSNSNWIFFLKDSSTLLETKGEKLEKTVVGSTFQTVLTDFQGMQNAGAVDSGKLLNFVNTLDQIKGPSGFNIVYELSGDFTAADKEILAAIGAQQPLKQTKGATYSNYLMTFNDIRSFFKALQACTSTNAGATSCTVGGKTVTAEFLSNKFLKGEFKVAVMNQRDLLPLDEEMTAYVLEKAAEAVNFRDSAGKEYTHKQLYGLLQFDAYLMKDYFTTQYRVDFKNAYGSKGADMTEWRFNPIQLGDPGKYKATINYNPAKTKANTNIALKLMETPENVKNNALLYMPFDASLTKGTEVLNKRDYGVSFPEGEANFSLSKPSADTEFKGLKGKSAFEFKLDTGQSFNAVKDGTILKIDRAKTSFRLTPSYPTPMGLSISSNGGLTTAGYRLLDTSSRPVAVSPSPKGAYLNWFVRNSSMESTAGGFADFGGQSAASWPDAKIAGCQLNGIGLTWASGALGEMKLQSIAYVPFAEVKGGGTPGIAIDESCTFSSIRLFNQDSAIAYAPPGPSSARALELSDTLNVRGKPSTESIEHLHGMLELAKSNEELICTKLTNNEVEFKWNPAKVYTQKFEEQLGKQ